MSPQNDQRRSATDEIAEPTTTSPTAATPTSMSPAFTSRRDSSLVRSVVLSGRVAGGALGIVSVLLAALLVLNVTLFGPRFDKAVKAALTVRLIHESLLDQQVGLRGYLLSGNDRFLESYERGRDTLPPLNADVTQHLGGDGKAGELYLSTRLAQEKWLQEWATEALELGRRVPAGETVSEEFLDKDKDLFDAYRKSHDELIAELIDRRQAAAVAQRRALIATVGFTLLVAMLGGATSIRRNRQLRDDVKQPMEHLVERLDDIGQGRLEARPLLAGPIEFQELSRGLEAAADALAGTRLKSDRQRTLLADQSRRQIEVLSFAREVSGSLSMRYVLRGMCVHASALTDNSRVLVWLLDDDRRELVAIADSQGPDFQPIGLDPIHIDEGHVGRAGRYGQIFDGANERGGAVNGRVAVPMIVGARVIGVLEIVGCDMDQLSGGAIEVLETMAVHAATALESARLHEHTAQMAMTDALTGLPNRRQLDLDLAVECSGSARYARPLSFMMVDVDHFKNYNDTFGHQAGDVALQELAQVIGHGLRATDTVYRYGGEEFAFVLRETSGEQVVNLAERVREAVQHHFSAPGSLREITISLGLAALPDHGPDPERLTAAADAALYQAKQTGRNRFCVAPSAVHVRRYETARFETPPPGTPPPGKISTSDVDAIA